MSTAPTTRAGAPFASAEGLKSALSSMERPSRPSPLSASLTFAWRGLLKIKHVPEQFMDVTITPVMFLLMFTYLFGGAIAGSTGDYLQYLLPGVLVMTVVFTTVYSGVTLNVDLTKGAVDRFRSLPISRSAPLVGPILSDSARYVVSATVTLVLGFILGFEAGGGVLGVLGAVALLIVFASGLSWAFTTLGTLMRNQNAVMNTGFMLMFPLTFASNVFVMPETMPSWLESIVEANPVTHLVDAIRGLLAGNAAGGDVVYVLVATVILTVVFAPLTVHRYRAHA